MLKNLCLLNGISGDERTVRDFICKQIEGKANYEIDNLGNVIAFKKGKKTPKNIVMVSAHMDEVGMIVTYINDDGTLKISPVGGVDPRVVFGRRVTVGDNKIYGVIGGVAVHNLSAEQRKQAVKFDEMNVDIGCDTKEQAEKSSYIRQEISNISNVIQMNAATAQQTASSTQQLSEQAENLRKMISGFRV